MEYIEQRIKQLKSQLDNPECNNPLKVKYKLEAYEEVRQYVSVKNKHNHKIK